MIQQQSRLFKRNVANPRSFSCTQLNALLQIIKAAGKIADGNEIFKIHSQNMFCLNFSQKDHLVNKFVCVKSILKTELKVFPYVQLPKKVLIKIKVKSQSKSFATFGKTRVWLVIDRGLGPDPGRGCHFCTGPAPAGGGS